jgi:GAF domain-containing protein
MAKIKKRGHKAPPRVRPKALGPKKSVAPGNAGDASLKRQLAEARAQQAATAGILKVISRSPGDVQPTFRAILESTTRMCESNIAALFLFDGKDLTCAAQHNTTPSFARFLQKMRAPPSTETPTRLAALKRKVVIVADYFNDPRFKPSPNVLRERTRSSLAVPLLREGALVGVITTWRREVRPFADSQIELLQTFADQAVIAIENVRLFDETKEALERQTATADILGVIASSPADVQPVFEAIIDCATRLMNAWSAAVLSFDGKLAHLRAIRGSLAGTAEFMRKQYPRPLGSGSLAARCMLEKATCHLTDALADPDPVIQKFARERQYRSALAVPLLKGGEPIGSISVSRVEPGGFRKAEIELLQTFADQAVIAIENVRLFNETKESLEQKTATAEILKVIASSPSDVQPVFDAIAASAMKLIGAFSALVSRVEGSMIYLVALTSTSKSGDQSLKSQFPRPLTSAGIYGTVVRSGKPAYLTDTENDAGMSPEGRAMARARGFRSVLAVPMLREGAVIGTINVSRREPGLFTDHQTTLLQTFADQAVIAIENARLFNETREALERQTATADILKVIASSPSDVQPVFDTIVKRARALCEGRYANVFRYDGEMLHFMATESLEPRRGIELMKAKYPMRPDASQASGRVILTGAIVRIEDSVLDPDYDPRLAASGGWRRMLAVPMLREGAPVGVIVVAWGEPGPIPKHHEELLKTFADQAVIAIENVRLFIETKEALERQTATADILKVISSSPTDTQPVFEAIVQSGLKLFPNAAVIVTVSDGDHGRLAAIADADPANAAQWAKHHRFPLTREYMHAVAILDRRVIDMPDAQAYEGGPLAAGIRNFLATGSRAVTIMPMLRPDAVIGTISVVRRAPGPLTEKQIALLRTFADQAVIAIENVRLFKELEARNRDVTDALEQQTATAEILRVISGSPTNVQPVFDAIAASALRLFGGLYVAVVLVRGEKIEIAAAGGAPEVVAKATSPFPIALDRESVTGRVIVDRMVQNMPDMEDPALPELARALSRGAGIRALLGAPMLREGAPIGAIMLMREHAGEFSAKQVALLKTFADQAVIAIENVRLFNETKEALERQTATAEILKVIASSPSDVQPVFDAIAKSAYRLIGGFSTAVARVYGDVLHLVAFSSTGEAGNEALKHAFPMPVARSKAARTAAPVCIADTEALPETASALRELARTRGFRSIVIVPMLRDGVATGTISVTRREPGEFTNHQVDLLKTFADQAVIAIENVRLFNETKEALERQTATAEILKVIASSPSDVQPVFDTIAVSALRLCEGSFSVVSRFDGHQIDLAAFSNLLPEYEGTIRGLFPMQPGRGSGTSRAISERQVVQIPDILEESEYQIVSAGETAKFRAVLAVPMLRDGVPIGAINVNRQQPGIFPEHQIALLKTFADQAVIAIENVRLFNETKEALERQTATAEILKVIAGSPSDVQPVFDAVVKSALRLVGGFTCAVTRLVGETLHLAAYTAINKSSDESVRALYPVKIEKDSQVTGAVVRTGTAKFFSDVVTDPRAPPALRDQAQKRGYRSLLLVPMLREGVTIGLIHVSRVEPGPFADHHIELLKTFADQAVIAIENVRLFNETKEALERQTATAEILRVISSSPTDVRPVLDAIVQSGARLFPPCNASIMMREGELIHLRAVAGPDTRNMEEVQALFPIPFEPKNIVAAQAMAERRIVQIPDTESLGDTRPRAVAVARAANYRSLTMVPLVREGQGIGAIALTHPEAGFRMNEKQLALVQTFADQAVIAIENVRLFNETKEALERQTATGEILSSISSSITDTKPVFDTITSNLMRLFGTRYASVVLLRDGRLELGGFAGEPGYEKLAATYPRPLDDTSMIGQAILSGHAVQVAPCVDNPAAPPKTAEIARLVGFNSVIAAPMIREGKVIGAISTSHRDAVPFNDKQTGLIKTFADQAVIAIENVRLFNETKESLERQTATAEILKVIASSPSDVQPVFEAILDGATRLCHAHLAVMNLFDGEHYRTVALRGGGPEFAQWALGRGAFKPTEGLARLVQARQAYQHADVRDSDSFRAGGENAVKFAELGGARTLLVVPLLKEGQLLGNIAIYRPEVRPFEQKQVELVGTFASQAVIAIENVRLFNETKDALEQQTATAEILQVISSSPTDTQPVFEAIVQAGLRLFPDSTVLMTIPGGAQVRAVAVANRDPERAKATWNRFPIALSRDRLHGAAILDGALIDFPDVEAETEGRFAPGARNFLASGQRAITIAPMMCGDGAIGAISVSRLNPGRLGEKQIALLRTFAAQAVIAIENVRVFKELEARTGALTRSVEQLTALGEVGQAIGSTLDLDTVLKTIVQRAVQLTGLDGGTIYEYDERSGEFNLRATENLSDELVEMLRETPMRRGEGVIGRAVETGEPIEIADMRDESYQSPRRDFLIKAGYRALLVVPLRREDHIIGALAVNRKAPGHFSHEVVELLKTFATQSAMAIQNARLFREIAEKGKQLEVASRHKSDFLASMSHELRTPLNAILGFNEMIIGQVYGEVPADMQEPLGDIQTSGKHLLRLINNVLDLAKIEAGRMELSLQDYSVHDTVASVHSTLRPLAAEKGLEFHAHVPNDVPLAFGDGGRITQCLMNLAGNSLKFTKAGKVEILVEYRGELLIYKVADTGIGIPPDKIGSLFTEFKQTDATIASEYGGTGLGLSISRKFVEMHGGRIWVESEPGKGSAFIIEVPLRVKTT